MKKLILIAALIFGISGYSAGQSASINSVDYKIIKKRTTRKPVHHFGKSHKDKKMRHNGTNFKRQTPYCVDLDGFAFNKHYNRKRRPER